MLANRKIGEQTSISMRLKGITFNKIFRKRNDKKKRVRPGVVELWGGGGEQEERDYFITRFSGICFFNLVRMYCFD